MSDDPRTILVRAPNWLGDLVMATPGLRALRARYPNAHIALHLPEAFVPLLAGTTWADELIPLAARKSDLRTLRRAARELRSRFAGGIDLGLCLPDSWSSALLMRFAGVRRVVGYGRDGRGWILHESVPVPREWGRRRMVARERFVAGLCEAVGARVDDLRLELPVDREQASAAQAYFERAGLDVSRPYAVLAPGASFGSSKCWPPESFAAVGDRLVRDGLTVVVSGAPDEAARVAAVRDAMGEPSVSACGRDVDLGVLKVLLRGARGLVANDAGARHVAVAFGTPAVVLFGPTALEKTDANLEGVVALEAAGVDCRPCYERECPIDHRCMNRIAPERVVDACSRWGAGSADRAGSAP